MIHGGDIYRNEVELDFSVNMNPLGVPQSVVHAMQEAVEHCIQYPDPKQEKLKQALAEYEQVEPEWILCGNGASELFLAIEHTICPKQIVIPVPSFYGYEQASRAGVAQIQYYQMKIEKDFVLDEDILSTLTEQVDLLYLANPNNPTGQLIPLELLEQILAKCEKCGIYVVLDECFLPFCLSHMSYENLHLEEKYPHLIRVRAFTKTFSIPGVRLGYLIAKDKNLLEKIQRQLPEWNLSVFAQMAGVAASKELSFLEESRKVLAKERTWLSEQLEKLEIKAIPSESNYILFQSELPWYQLLLKRKILVRDCSNYRGLGANYHRIAVKSHAENEKLIETMKVEKERYLE